MKHDPRNYTPTETALLENVWLFWCKQVEEAENSYGDTANSLWAEAEATFRTYSAAEYRHRTPAYQAQLDSQGKGGALR